MTGRRRMQITDCPRSKGCIEDTGPPPELNEPIDCLCRPGVEAPIKDAIAMPLRDRQIRKLCGDGIGVMADDGDGDGVSRKRGYEFATR
jgi:hypothetical protein